MVAFFNLFDDVVWPLAIFAAGLVAASVGGTILAGARLHQRRERVEQNRRLFGAITNMNQGLCMFDAQSRLVIWNECFSVLFWFAFVCFWVGCFVLVFFC